MRRPLRSGECEGTTVIISAADTLAVAEHIVRVPVLLDADQSVVVLTKVSPHPVNTVTAGPVDILGVGEIIVIKIRLHPLLYPAKNLLFYLLAMKFNQL